MSKKYTVKDIVAMGGGATKLSSELGISTFNISRWMQIDTIPRKHWHNVAKAVGCSYEDLLQMKIEKLRSMT